jgi:hypothetical protein
MDTYEVSIFWKFEITASVALFTVGFLDFDLGSEAKQHT